MSSKLTPTFKSCLVAATFVVLPLLVGILVYWKGSHWFSSEIPNYWWRVAYCVLIGFWGLAMRAYERRDKLWIKDGTARIPWDYFFLYPLGLIVNGCAVFTILMLFDSTRHGLFWTAAVPVGVIFGRYAHPGEWKITKALDKAIEKLKDH